MSKFGKKFDTWKVMTETGEATISVYHQRDYSSTTFTAVCTKHDITDRDANIDTLRRRVEKRVEECARERWLPKILVTVGGSRTDACDRDEFEVNRPRFTNHATTETQTEFQITWQTIEVTVDGKRYRHRSYGRFGGADRTHAIQAGLPECYDGSRAKFSYLKQDEARAMIDDTPENRAALVRVRIAAEGLRERLMDLFQPSAIEVTLGRILAGSSPMLLSGNGERKGREP